MGKSCLDSKKFFAARTVAYATICPVYAKIRCEDYLGKPFPEKKKQYCGIDKDKRPDNMILGEIVSHPYEKAVSRFTFDERIKKIERQAAKSSLRSMELHQKALDTIIDAKKCNQTFLYLVKNNMALDSELKYETESGSMIKGKPDRLLRGHGQKITAVEVKSKKSRNGFVQQRDEMQIKTYMFLIKKMGFTPRGYVLYLKNDIVQEVGLTNCDKKNIENSISTLEEIVQDEHKLNDHKKKLEECTEFGCYHVDVCFGGIYYRQKLASKN